jgi:hypothetical protein
MFSIYFKTRMIMLFSRYKADFLRFFPENAANYVSILMYELQRKAPSERRKGFPRTPQQVRGLVHQSTKPLDPPLCTKCRVHSRMARVAFRPISIQCKISRDQLFAISFFWNAFSEPDPLCLIACISKESDRKMSIARHFALNGNPPLWPPIAYKFWYNWPET